MVRPALRTHSGCLRNSSASSLSRHKRAFRVCYQGAIGRFARKEYQYSLRDMHPIGKPLRPDARSRACREIPPLPLYSGRDGGEMTFPVSYNPYRVFPLDGEFYGHEEIRWANGGWRRVVSAK